MPIKRCSEQNRKTLEEFYLELSFENNSFSKECGDKMLDLIAMINQTFIQTRIWGITSHSHLNLLNKDDGESPSYITVIFGFNQYYFEYLIPDSKSPWPNARVKGYANSLEEAKKLLIIAMKESEAWPDSTELQDLSSN